MDEGEIKCTATNRAGHAITKARLRLEGKFRLYSGVDYQAQTKACILTFEL